MANHPNRSSYYWIGYQTGHDGLPYKNDYPYEGQRASYQRGYNEGVEDMIKINLEASKVWHEEA